MITAGGSSGGAGDLCVLKVIRPEDRIAAQWKSVMPVCESCGDKMDFHYEWACDCKPPITCTNCACVKYAKVIPPEEWVEKGDKA